MKRVLGTVFLTFLMVSWGLNYAHAGPSEARHQRLSAVSHWFYHLGFELEGSKLRQMAKSEYDMIVIEPIFTEAQNQNFPIRSVIEQLKAQKPDRIVLAYIDIGQAEEWRDYWQEGWGIGSPDWIVANDPDGWEGNYPVAYWNAQWRNIWLGKNGQLSRLIAAGFDGVYLDWVEAYSDENVIAAARRSGVNPKAEMIRFVSDIAAFGRARNAGFIVIGQNAAELGRNRNYARAVDAIAQEQVWFDGGSDNRPKGDCPLPATDADIETRGYVASLSSACRRQHDAYPDSTLHVSSQGYIRDLRAALNRNLVIFSVDYAVKPANIRSAKKWARQLGFVPFVGTRALDGFIRLK